jgi:hypothetical protein
MSADPREEIVDIAKQKATELTDLAQTKAAELTSGHEESPEEVMRAAALFEAAALKASELVAIARLQAEQLATEKRRSEDQRDVLLAVFREQLIPSLEVTASTMHGVNDIMLQVIGLLDREGEMLSSRTALFTRIITTMDRIEARLVESGEAMSSGGE